MTRRAKIITIVAVCVVALGAIVVIAGPPIYRDYFAAPAAEVPTLTAEDGALTPDSTEPLDVADLSGEWAVTDGSEAGYRVDEVLRGTDVEVTGRTSEVIGSLQVTDLTVESAEFTVDIASIATDQPSRDDYFRNTAMRVGEHPTATFRLTEPVTASALPEPGETVELQFTGDLTLAGVTQSVTFTAQARTDGTTAEVAGQIPITFEDYGVTAPDLGFVRVEPTGYVEFSLVFARQG